MRSIDRESGDDFPRAMSTDVAASSTATEDSEEGLYGPRVDPIYLLPDDVPTQRPSVEVVETREYHAWATELGGQPAFVDGFRLTITSRDDAPVLITGVGARIVEKAPAPDGWYIDPDHNMCGGGEEEEFLLPWPLLIDLEAGGEAKRPRTDYGRWPRTDAGGLVSLKATREKPQVLDVTVLARFSLIKYMLVVDHILDGEVTQQEVGLNGEPLTLSGLVPGKAKAYYLPYASAPRRSGDPSSDGVPAGAPLQC